MKKLIFLLNKIKIKKNKNIYIKMSQFPINNSFSFYKKYYAAHEFSSEYPASQNPTIPQNNFIGP